MTEPRFLIAKYVPDLRRMEPRNIGVILWSESGVASRFLDSPRFVEDRTTYEQWREFWQITLDRPEFRSAKHGAVKKSSPDYLAAVRETSKGNYYLVEGGRILDELQPKERGELLEYLFNDLVDQGLMRQVYYYPSLACTS